MLWPYFPIVVYTGATALFLGLYWLGAGHWRRQRKRSPLARDLLRSPGESLRRQIDEVDNDLLLAIVFPTGMPVLLLAVYQAQLPNGKPASHLSALLYVVTAIAFVGYFAYKAIRLARRRRRLMLGYEAERAVGQELDQLLRDKYWLFHDVPFERFNIDHVVVGRTGVFAVETKGRTKPLTRAGRPEWEVTFDGNKLQFPGWSETDPLEQARRQARDLQRWLASAVGQEVSVQPVLALPGWYIKRTQSGGMPVFNGKNPSGFFRQIGKAQLPDELVTRIVHQLDQRCRDVAPRAYARQPAMGTS